MPIQATTQTSAIRQATEQSLLARNRYTEQVINVLTDDLAAARAQVGTAILHYKSLGSLPDNKLAGLKGLERLDAEIKSIMGELRRSHSVRFRAESKAAFRLGVYQGIEEFATSQLPVYRDLTPEGLEKLTGKAFQIVDTDALDFLANYTTTLAGDVNRETTDGIMRTIRGAIATGKGVDDIVRDLGEVVKDKDSFRHAGSKVFSKAQYRMEVIARTEVLRAHNLGKLKFHQAVGIQRLEWFTMDDERVCPVCGPLDGKSFPLDQFPQQPAHPQCRCGHYPAWPLVVCGHLPRTQQHGRPFIYRHDHTKGAMKMTRQEFEAWATAHGWTKDQWGHYHKGDRRFKLSKVAVRLEAKAGSAGWVRLRSGYFSKLHITDAGKLAGLAY